jgi:aryl-alcohol dehydrogenase-like predicted oxidoreductase
MRYKVLGKSGLRVSELCLGAMTFGLDWGTFGASKEESRKIFDAFVGAGGNFVDTANKYTDGTSEKYVGEFIHSEREKFVLATKYTLTTNPEDPNASGNHRKNLIQSVESSLKRLNTEYIDLLWVHAWDYMTPVEELMRSLDDMVRSGRILYVGISDAPAWVISQANTLAQLQGWSPFVGIQIQYSLIERTPERELLPMARSLDIGVTAWAPLGGGILTGKYDEQNDETKRYDPSNTGSSAFLNEEKTSIAREVMAIANEMDQSPARVALNWLRQQKDKGVLIPIVGARTEAQIKDNLGCLDFEIPLEFMEKLDRISAVSLGFPQDFLTTDRVRQFIYGKTVSQIDFHRNDTL